MSRQQRPDFEIPQLQDMGRIEPWQEVEVPRRRILKAAMLTAAGFCIDQAVGEYIYGGTSPEINLFSDNALPYLPNTVTYVCPGFNVPTADGIAAALRPTLDRYGIVKTVRYSSNGLQTEDLERALVKDCKRNGYTTVNFYGHSFAGMLAIEFSHRLSESGIKPGFVVLDSSPKEHQDVKGTAQQWSLDFLTLMDRLQLHGGQVTRIGMETIGKFVTSDSDIVDSLQHAVHKAGNGQISNSLVQDEARYIHQYRAEGFSKHLKDLAVCHLGPYFAQADNVVNDPRALRGWKKCFKETGVTCADSKRTGHADPSSYPRAYNRMLSQVLRERNIVDVESVRRHRPRPGNARIN